MSGTRNSYSTISRLLPGMTLYAVTNPSVTDAMKDLVKQEKDLAAFAANQKAMFRRQQQQQQAVVPKHQDNLAVPQSSSMKRGRR